MQLSKALEGYEIATFAEGYSQLTLVTFQKQWALWYICYTG